TDLTDDRGQFDPHWIAGVLLQPDGKIVEAGTDFLNGDNPGLDGTTPRFAVTRHNADGTVDWTFGQLGFTTVPFPRGGAQATSVALQSDGKLVVAGVFVAPGATRPDFALARLNPDGTPDSSFGTNGLVITDFGAPEWASSVVVQADGSILAAGSVGGDFAV